MVHLSDMVIWLLLYVASANAFIGWSKGCSSVDAKSIDDAVDEVVIMANGTVLKSLINRYADKMAH
jgi:uncharacterized membrane protein